MMVQLLELRIEDILMEHIEVKKKKVGKYAMRYENGEYVQPISVLYCVHTGHYFVSDGHHRMVAKHFLGESSILAEIEPCYLYHCKGNEPIIPFYNIRHNCLI